MTAFSQFNPKRSPWSVIILFALVFWLSASVILDLVVMPSLYAAGMMSQPGFASAGSMIFGAFNRIELIGAALIASGIFVVCTSQQPLANRPRIAMILAVLLLGIVAIDTYGLAPQMSALGAQFNLFESAESAPEAMNWMHGSYFGLELVKLGAIATLASWCYRKQLSWNDR
jgi:hypothetical protein